MSITKPFTFVAGTKARANEVNQNFDVLYSQVNSNISAINTNANDIDTLDSNKANINGSSSQPFNVQDISATSTTQAVNAQSMRKALTPLYGYIEGYVISKDSGSPNDTILVTAGSCYDSTNAVVLAKDTSTTKQNINQGASTTYYVYVIGNGSGSSVDILISDLSVTPLLPEGYTKFNKIGYYITDGDGNIASIYSFSNASISRFAPDYNRATSVSYSSGDTVGFDGWLAIEYGANNLAVISWIAINGIIVMQTYGGNQDGGGRFSAGICMVKATDVITYQNIVLNNVYAPVKMYKMPFIGG